MQPNLNQPQPDTALTKILYHAPAMGTAQKGAASLSELADEIERIDRGNEGVSKMRESGNSQASRLVKLAEDAELFHTPQNEAFVSFLVGDHREIWPLRTKQVRQWLSREFYLQTKKVPGTQALQDAMTTLEGMALFDGPEYRVSTRLAEHEGSIFLDLANDRWQAVKIASEGWSIVSDPPVKFRRTRGMLALPDPVFGGSILELRPFLNLANEKDWMLLAGWLIAAYRPRGPYPILSLHGEQGNAKSTTARLLKALIDPNEASLRSEPTDLRDLMIGARNGWVLAFDNLSSLSSWLSDALCRVSTGGGFSTRELYSDTDEVLFHGQRPVLLNGIGDLATRGDLLDRSLPLCLPVIQGSARRQESEFWSSFEKARPRILGALLDAIVYALVHVETVKLSCLPRMADFAVWVTASTKALGFEPDAFLAAYSGNREDANELALEASPISSVVRELAADKPDWTGTATDLLKVVNVRVDDQFQRQRGWPKSPKALSNALRRIAPNLRAIGVEVSLGEREPSRSRRRLIRLTVLPERRVPDQSDQSEASEPQAGVTDLPDGEDGTDDIIPDPSNSRR